MDEIKRRILEYVLRNGPIPLYKLAKEFGLSYGSAQWHVFWLERAGLVKSVRVGKRRYIAAEPSDLLRVARVGDLLEDLELALIALGVRPEMSLEEALAVLEKKAPHIAELLRKMVGVGERK